MPLPFMGPRLVGFGGPKISFVAAFTGSTSLTLSGIAAGDLLIFVGYDYSLGSNPAPALPAGFTSIASAGSITYAYRYAYKIAAGGETSVSAGASTDDAIILQYRGPSLSIGANSTHAAGSSGTATFNPVTLQKSDGSSWVASIMDCGGRNATLAPSGETFRTLFGSFGAAYDTNQGVASFASRTLALEFSAAWNTMSIEIKTT